MAVVNSGVFSRACKWIFAALLVFVPATLFSRPSFNIVRINERPAIDGVLSEEMWKLADPVNGFVQREPDNGAPATQQTEFYMLYDDDYIYIGVRCFDDPDRIISNQMARDADLSRDDRVQIILDTHLDGRNAYWFQISPRGSIGDAVISENGAGFNRNWQGLWEGRATIQPYGWEAEIAIPFKTINFNRDQSTWGVKFIRYIRRNLESVYWPGSNINNHRFYVADAGLMHGLENISQGVGLDINPYGIAGHNYPGVNGRQVIADAGADIFYQITPGIRSVLTINTDFAETEADSRQVNLTRYSLHFPEKRDFFLDGASYFNFGINGERENPYNKRLIPFFSRRLGLDSGGQPLPIYAGARVTGQTGNWNFGAVNILQEEQFENRNFSALRVSRNIGRQSSAGMIATIGNVTASGSNALWGLDTKIATSEFAGDKNLSFVAYGLQSVTEKAGESKSADHAFGAELSYPNDLLYGRAGFMQIDENFTAGMGFVPRRGIREFYLMAGAGPRPGKWGILQVLTNGSVSHISDLDGVMQTREIEMKPLDIRFQTGELFTASVLFSHENLENDFNLLNSVVIAPGEYSFRSSGLSFSSAQQRDLWGEISYEWGGFYNGSRKTVEIESGWQVFVNLFLGAEFEKSYLDFPSGAFDVSVYRAVTNILFSPNVNLFTFLQYDDISETAGWQFRFRWIMRPGREVLLAWNSIIADPMERFTVTDNALRFKFKYNIRF